MKKRGHRILATFNVQQHYMSGTIGNLCLYSSAFLLCRESKVIVWMIVYLTWFRTYMKLIRRKERFVNYLKIPPDFRPVTHISEFHVPDPSLISSIQMITITLS